MADRHERAKERARERVPWVHMLRIMQYFRTDLYWHAGYELNSDAFDFDQKIPNIRHHLFVYVLLKSLGRMTCMSNAKQIKCVWNACEIDKLFQLPFASFHLKIFHIFVHCLHQMVCHWKYLYCQENNEIKCGISHFSIFYSLYFSWF